MNPHLLRRGDTLSLTNGAGVAVKVAAGDIWLTQPGDTRDRMMKSGGLLRIEAKGTVLIYAFADSQVELTGAEQAIMGVRRRGELPAEAPAPRNWFAALRQVLNPIPGS